MMELPDVTKKRNCYRVFTITSTCPFSSVLVQSLLSGKLVPGFYRGNALELALATIFVPTVYDAIALQNTFLELVECKAAALPRIVPIMEIGDRYFTERFAELDLVIAKVARQIDLTKLVLSWKKSRVNGSNLGFGNEICCCEASMSATAAITKDCIRFLDSLESDAKALHDISELTLDTCSPPFGLPMDLLNLLIMHWKEICKSESLSQLVGSRYQLICKEAADLLAYPPSGPVIMVVSMDSIPVVAELLNTVMQTENGVIVFPRLELNVNRVAKSDDCTDALSQSEANSKLQQYSTSLINSKLVQDLEPAADPSLIDRIRIISQAMHAVSRIDSLDNLKIDDYVTQGVTIVEAKNEAEEALSIVMALKEGLEHGKTSVLVTPDRSLARRVSVELERFGLSVNDTRGTPLSRTLPATLAHLLLRLVSDDVSVVDIASLLHHPLLRFGLSEDEIACATRVIELVVLRGDTPITGLDDFVTAVRLISSRIHENNVDDRDITAAHELLVRLVGGVQPLRSLRNGKPALFYEWLEAQHSVFTFAIHDHRQKIPENSKQCAQFIRLITGLIGITKDMSADLRLSATDYITLMKAIMDDLAVCDEPHSNCTLISIWSPFEARLQYADRVILGSLVEGVWEHDTVFNGYTWRNNFNLSSSTCSGIVPHDFIRWFGSPEVVLTRALNIGGTPTILSRCVQKLQVVFGSSNTERLKDRGRKYLSWARALDRRGDINKIERPAPIPSLHLRPRKLSVNDVAIWMRDPYSFYAKCILKLNKLNSISACAGAFEGARIISKVIHRYVLEGTSSLSSYRKFLENFDCFQRIVDEELEFLSAFPSSAVLCRADLLSIGRWFVNSELARCDQLKRVDTNVTGYVDLCEGKVRLEGRIDRIDVLQSNKLVIVDYKATSPPSIDQVKALSAPQLPLKSMLLRSGAFGETYIGAEISELVYLYLVGGNLGGKWISVDTAGDAITDEVHKKFCDLVTCYEDPSQGYVSRPSLTSESFFNGDYDHLARAGEWSTVAARAEADLFDDC